MIEDLHIIDSPIGPVIPVDEVAKHIGYSRSAVSNTINNPENRALFAPFISSVRVKGTGGYRTRLCITKAGMEELIAHHLRPINRDNLPARIGKFREAMVKRSADPAPSDILTEYGKQARALATEWGVDITVARKVLMAAAVEECPKLTPCRALIPANSAVLELPEKTGPNSSELELPQADPDFERYYSLEKLADYCQCSRDTARNILEDEKIIERVNGIWRLTKKGLDPEHPYGKMFPHMPWYPHLLSVKWAIRYHPNATHFIRGKILGVSVEPAKFQMHPAGKATPGA